MRTFAARLALAIALAAALVTGASSPSSAAIVLGPTDALGTYPRPVGDVVLWGGGEALGINDGGTIVGVTPEDGSIAGTAFAFDPATHSMRRLGTFGDSGDDSRAHAVNGPGVAVGQVFLTDVTNHTQPARFTFPPTQIDLVGGLGGNVGTAHDINDAGSIVGESTLPGDAVTHAFVADPGLATTDIGALPGGQSSSAAGIDEQGVVVGTSEVGGTAPCLADPTSTCPRTHAFTYDTDTHVLTDLGALPGGTSSEATDINDTGTIVGSSLVPGPGGTFTTHPFSYDLTTGTFRDLGLLPGTTVNRATAVNDDGVVVGNIASAGAWVHDPADGELVAATGVHRLDDINDHGMAVGSGLVPTGDDEEDNPLPGFVIGSLRLQVLVGPGAPVVERASTCGGSAVIGWAPPLDTGYATTGISYRVLRDGTSIGTTTNRGFVDPGSHTGAAYSVQTLTIAGESAPSTPLLGTCSTSIGGTVTSDGSPVGGIDVRVHSFSSGLLVAKTRTAANGTYALTGLAPGSYQVRFSSPSGSYVLQWNGGAPSRAEAGAVIVGTGSTTVDAALSVPGIVAGTVMDAAGPVADIDVRAYVTGTSFAIAKTRTAADGTYELDGLPAGSYEIRFSSPTGGHVLQWNGGAATRSAAPPVVVTTTSTVALDVTLVVAGTITGRFVVPGPFGGFLDAGGVDVRIYPIGAPAIAKTTTASDGRFVVAGLPAGSYRVLVSDPRGRFSGIQWLADDGTGSGELFLVPSIAEATAFAVVAGDVTDIGAFSRG